MKVWNRALGKLPILCINSLVCFGKLKSIEEWERPKSEGYQSHITALVFVVFILVSMLIGNDANHDVHAYF